MLIYLPLHLQKLFVNENFNTHINLKDLKDSKTSNFQLSNT